MDTELRDKFRRLLKYVLEWIIVYTTVRYLPSCDNSFNNAFIIASVASVMLAILDIYCPSIVIEQSKINN